MVHGDSAGAALAAAYELGVVATQLELPEPERHAYCIDIAHGIPDLAARTDLASAREKVSLDRRRQEYLCQAMFDGVPDPSFGSWDPLTGSLAISETWIAEPLERLLSHAQLSETELALGVWALAMNLHLTLEAAGPEDVGSLHSMGFSTYHLRSAKAWEAGITQLALEANFDAMVRGVGLDSHPQRPLEWDPFTFALFPREFFALSVITHQIAESRDSTEEEIVRSLVREFPDTRPGVVASLVAGPTSEVSATDAIEHAVNTSFAKWGSVDRTASSSLEDAIYLAGYLPFRSDVEQLPELGEIRRCEAALAAALPQAASFAEVGAILGQGSTLRTLSDLLQKGALRPDLSHDS